MKMEGKLSRLLLLVLALVTCDCLEYYGKRIGSFKGGNNSPTQHEVSGTVYVVSSTHIFIKDFNYDGNGPDAFFWIGKSSSSSTPHSDGKMILDEYGRSQKLSAYRNADISLKLPADVAPAEIKWLSVWCRQVAANFGEVILPADFTEESVPKPKSLGKISELAHGVRTGGDVVIENHRTFLINQLYYDGNGPDAFFLLGTGTVPGAPGTYIKLPDEAGSLSKAHRYNGETLRIQVPAGRSISEFNYLSLYCILAKSNFGSVVIPAQLNIPAYLTPPTTVLSIQPWNTTLANCEHLHDKVNIGWEIQGEMIKIELISVTGDSEYVAFGLSGSPDTSLMLGADVTVTYFEDTAGQPRAVDHFLGAYAQCSNGRGACPDTTLGGSNDVTVVNGSRENGLTKVTYTRNLITNDIKGDKQYRPNTQQHVVWAVGKLNPEMFVTKHHTRITSPVQLKFGRDPANNCAALPVATPQPTSGWPASTINGRTVTKFVVRIGPTGGDRGYKFITGEESWGIAYYINGLLIPELTLVRGKKYIFQIETGDDLKNTARYHPFYITTDPRGGYSQLNAQQRAAKQVVLGVEANGAPSKSAVGKYCEYEQLGSVNTADTSATFQDYFKTLTLNCPSVGNNGSMVWTPDASTPDLLYYQCYTHFRLGWKIHVVTSGERSVHYSVTWGLLILFTAVVPRIAYL